MRTWRDCRLGDLLRIKHGFAFKGEHFASSGDSILLSPGNFRADGGLQLKGEKEKFYAGPIPDDFVLDAGDLLVAMTDLIQNAPILGSAAFIPEPRRFLHNQRLGKVVELNEKETSKKFVYYLFNYERTRAQIRASATGATVRHTAPERIYTVRVMLPPPSVQHRIVAVLSAYDDLIANCERRVRILDEMARALYREWFVLFRYPGHKRHDLSGPLPKGWQRAPISQVYAGLYDGPHATPPPSNEGPVFLGIGNITESGRLDLSDVRHIAESDFPRWTKRATPQAGDIVFTYEATLHRYAMIPDGFRGCLGRRLALIRPDPAKKCGRFLFFTLLSDGWRDVVTSNILAGATVDRIPLSRVPDFPITLPPMPLVVRFDEAVRPLVDEETRLSELKANLRNTRDLLLPRLLSGQLDVGDAA